MNASTLQRVKSIAADLFNVSLDQLSPASSPDTIEAWDSLNHLNLVLALERDFRIQLEPEEIEQMLSLELTAMLVEEKLDGTA